MAGTPEQAIDAANQAFGRHPRAARGMPRACCSPLFPTRTPKGFVAFIGAQAAGAAAAWRLPRFLARHPAAIRVLPMVAPTLLPPASYATIPYFGLHAFRLITGPGQSHHVRYILRPDATVSQLAPWKARRLGTAYLQQEIAARVAGGPVRFTLEVQIAEPGDPVADPSAAWPKERRVFPVGRLEIGDRRAGHRA